MIVPNARPGILAGALSVVTLSLGEFNLTWMLHTPLTKTLPVGLADSYASMRLEVASAYTLVFFVMIIPLLVAMQLFADLPAPQGAAMSGSGGVAVDLEACAKTLRRHPRARAADACGRARRDGGSSRAVGVRQDHPAAHHCRPGDAGRRRARAVQRHRT